LVATLHAHGLIDEYRLMVFPIIVGGGKRLFDESGTQSTLKLVDAAPAGDTVLLRYHRG
jgi:dihydrofolate reductase